MRHKQRLFLAWRCVIKDNRWAYLILLMAPKLLRGVRSFCEQGTVTRATRELPLPTRRRLEKLCNAYGCSGQRDWSTRRARKAVGGARRPSSNSAGLGQKADCSAKQWPPRRAIGVAEQRSRQSRCWSTLLPKAGAAYATPNARAGQRLKTGETGPGSADVW